VYTPPTPLAKEERVFLYLVVRLLCAKSGRSVPCGKHLLPVLLHIHNDPAIGIRLVESLVELTDVAFAVVGKLAVRICVVNKESQSTAFTTHGVFDHLDIAVGIAECQNRTATNVLIDSYRLARLVVDEINLRHADEFRLAVLDLKFRNDAGTDDLFRRNTIQAIPPPETMKVLNSFARRYSSSSTWGL